MDETPTHNSISSLRVGMLATLSNRRAIVSAVEPYDGKDGRLHLVHLEYIDPDGVPTDTVVWERELGAKLLEPLRSPMYPPTLLCPQLSSTP